MLFARGVYEEASAMRLSAQCMLSSAYGALLLGRFEEAEEELRLALGIASSLDYRGGVLVAKQNLGLALLRRGKLEECIAIEREALAMARAQKNLRMAGACLYYLSLAFHARGDQSEAEMHAEESARACEHIPPSRAEALAALAQARLAKGEAQKALASAKEAMSILEEVGGIDEGEPFIRLVWAEALRASGAAEDARVAIGQARAHVLGRAEKLAADDQKTFLAISENARTLELAQQWGARPER